MRCGVVADSYRTVSALTFVLANGAVIDTADADAEEQFAAAAPELAAGLARIRDRIRADAELAERVARKFQIKNTTGYRLCAFLDADTPLEIFRRLVVGSEGTLAFVAEAVFDTVPLGRHTTLALVGFEDLDAAAGAVGELVDAGATATELMVAPTLIAAAYNMPGTPEAWKELPADLGGAADRVPRRDARGARRRWRRPPERSCASAAVTARSTRRPGRSPARPRRSRCSGACARACRACWPRCARPAITMIIEDVCVPAGARRRGGQGPAGAAGQARLPPGPGRSRLRGQPALHPHRRVRQGGRARALRRVHRRHGRADRRQVRRLAQGRARHRDQHGAVRRARVGRRRRPS